MEAIVNVTQYELELTRQFWCLVAMLGVSLLAIGTGLLYAYAETQYKKDIMLIFGVISLVVGVTMAIAGILNNCQAGYGAVARSKYDSCASASNSVVRVALPVGDARQGMPRVLDLPDCQPAVGGAK